MSNEILKGTARRLVEHCRAHTERLGLKELYAPDAVSVKAMPMPGSGSAETHGIAALEGKHDWWEETMEVHSATADGPFIHGDDRFAVIFGFDATDRSTGARSSSQEVGIYTVNAAGKIIREEFYYQS